MNTRFGLTTWCTLVLLFFFANSATAEIELYDFPTSAPRATDLEVAVDGQPVFVLKTNQAFGSWGRVFSTRRIAVT